MNGVKCMNGMISVDPAPPTNDANDANDANGVDGLDGLDGVDCGMLHSLQPSTGGADS